MPKLTGNFLATKTARREEKLTTNPFDSFDSTQDRYAQDKFTRMDTNFLDADYAVVASESILVYAYILMDCFKNQGFFE